MMCQGQAGDAPLAVSTTLTVGEVIGERYRIEAVIGRGGMSVVYRATHLVLGQSVAIKVLSQAAMLLPEHIARLTQEARAASRIRSEHVARVFDFGEVRGSVPYLVMECLEGADLAAVLARRGRLPLPLVVECVVQACEALAEAHAMDIVHRDLKPANLFLTEGVDGSPCVKVLDFGISRTTRRAALSSLTDPGIVLGTPSYMAPEQMEGGRSVDARADIWALGAILYELLVGKRPFSGDRVPDIFIQMMRSRTPRPSMARNSLPPEIDAIVARCLALEPEGRYRNVAELADALAPFGPPRVAESARRVSRVWKRGSPRTSATMPLAAMAAGSRAKRIGAAVCVFGIGAVAAAIQSSEPSALDRAIQAARREIVETVEQVIDPAPVPAVEPDRRDE